MTHNLNDFLADIERKKYATQQGTNIHFLLQQVVVDDVVGDRGDADMVAVIKQKSDLCPYFIASAKTEVPVAGIINGTFVSRRIDRLLIDEKNKTVVFLDYKTDVDKSVFRDVYKKQLNEYAQLLHSAYPKHKITGFILWTQDWTLERMISM